MSQTDPITCFRGSYGFLSNFYLRPLRFESELYRSAEHAYQAQKPVAEYDKERIKAAMTPSLAKKIAASCFRKQEFEARKVFIMKSVLRAKFAPELHGIPNPLLGFLLKTGNRELIEGNAWDDTFWGQCPIGNGENMLGKLLMEVRSEMAQLIKDVNV